MLSKRDTQIARRLKSRLQQTTHILKLIVYGSRARGDALPESDMDIFIEVPVLTPGLRQQISEVAWEVSFRAGIVISTFVTTPQDIQEGPSGANPLLNAIEREGIAV